LFERFTERARQVVVLAQDEARALKHNYIGTEHILLGLLREEEGLAARVLESLDITVEEVRAQVARIVGQGDEVTTGQIPFTPRAKKVLELALREALSIGHNYIGSEHILLGLVRENNGVAARILLDFDADAEKIRNEIIRMLSGPGRRQSARKSASQSLSREPATPPVSPEVVAELRKVRAELEAALEAQEFEQAAALRDREQSLTQAARRLERAWAGEPEFVSMEFQPSSVTLSASGRPWTLSLSGRRRARTGNRRRPRAPRPQAQLVPIVVGWLLFGIAAGTGLLVGRLIWG
jgi:ATP-dependent Clp protease ATP-binding subunit ClpA